MYVVVFRYHACIFGRVRTAKFCSPSWKRAASRFWKAISKMEARDSTNWALNAAFHALQAFSTMLSNGLYGGRNLKTCWAWSTAFRAPRWHGALSKTEGGGHVAKAHRNLLQKVDEHGTSCPTIAEFCVDETACVRNGHDAREIRTLPLLCASTIRRLSADDMLARGIFHQENCLSLRPFYTMRHRCDVTECRSWSAFAVVDNVDCRSTVVRPHLDSKCRFFARFAALEVKIAAAYIETPSLDW